MTLEKALEVSLIDAATPFKKTRDHFLTCMFFFKNPAKVKDLEPCPL